MSHSTTPERDSGPVITGWRPEDPAFWQQRGQRIASRNLWISVPCLLLAFCVWMLFSAVAVNLPKVGFKFTTDQLFMLTALPALSGALLRVPYAFMVPIFGGRRWTAFSTGIMIVPCVWLGFAVQDTTTPFSTFILISLLCGLAGANFASSMANISFFFPKQKQGGALGIFHILQQTASSAQAARGIFYPKAGEIAGAKLQIELLARGIYFKFPQWTTTQAATAFEQPHLGKIFGVQ